MKKTLSLVLKIVVAAGLVLLLFYLGLLITAWI